MRIISGKYKGRRIMASKKLPARPTTDFAKEALFNILNNHYNFSDLKVLDLFAGIGSIGFEFASRGCENVICVESHRASAKFIKDTTELLELPVHVIAADVYSYLKTSKASFDIIFADPPYNFSVDQLQKFMKIIFSDKLLEPDGLLIIEHSKYTDLSECDGFMYAKKYGSSEFSFFEKKEEL